MKTTKITKQWLQEQGACSDGVAWFEEQKVVSLPSLMKKALTQRQFNFANWGLVRLMTQQQQVQYACFSALQSVHEFEKMSPNDKRPREAIVEALRWALDPSEANRSAAESAAWSAAREKLLLYGLKVVLKQAIIKSVNHFMGAK